MEISKVYELIAEYLPEQRAVEIRLRHRKSGTILDKATVPLGWGYPTNMRLARARLLEKAGIHESQVLGV